MKSSKKTKTKSSNPSQKFLNSKSTPIPSTETRKSITVAYMRVSTHNQTIESQKAAIFEFANKNSISIDHCIEVTAISAKMDEDKRKITELKALLQENDTLIVTALDRLGRSIHQIVNLINWLVEHKINFIVTSNDSIRLKAGSDDFVTKILTTIFGILAEVEHKVLQDRIRSGVKLALDRGVKFGWPKGKKKKSRLDGKEDVVRASIEAGVPKTRIAKNLGVSVTALNYWIKSRNVVYGGGS